MKYRIFVLTAFYCALAAILSPAHGQQADATVSRPGLFSYQAPPGWRVLTLPRIENPIATDPQQREASPYIEVDTAASVASLADFAEANKKSMKAMVPSTEFIDEKPFVTAAGLQGIRIVTTAHPGQRDQQAIYYPFDGPQKTKFVVIANVAPAAFEKNAPLFDAAIKTFVLQ
jgi:hypothetical protein